MAFGCAFAVGVLASSAAHGQSLYVMSEPTHGLPVTDVKMSKDGRTLVRLSWVNGYYDKYYPKLVLEFGRAGEAIQEVEANSSLSLVWGIANARLAGISRDGQRASYAIDDTDSGQLEIRNVYRDGRDVRLFRNAPWTDENLKHVYVAESGRDAAYEFEHPRYVPRTSFVVRSDGVERQIPKNIWDETMEIYGISCDASHAVGRMNEYRPVGGYTGWAAPVVYRDSDRSLTYLPNIDSMYEHGSADVITPDARVVFGTLRKGYGVIETTVRWDLSGATPVVASWLESTIAIDSNDAGTVALVRRVDAHDGSAFLLWTVDRGTISVLDAMRDSGLSLPQTWTRIQFHSLSGDGLSVFGTANDGGLVRNFIVTIPTPGMMGVAMASIVIARRRRR